MAQAVAQGAIDKCRADGYRVTVTVVNAEGLIKLQLRDDGAAPHTIDLSRKKAYTAASQRRNSGEVAQQWVNIPMPNIEGIVALAGGVPIKAGKEVIAAVGVSGAPAGTPAGRKCPSGTRKRFRGNALDGPEAGRCAGPARGDGAAP